MKWWFLEHGWALEQVSVLFRVLFPSALCRPIPTGPVSLASPCPPQSPCFSVAHCFGAGSSACLCGHHFCCSPHLFSFSQKYVVDGTPLPTPWKLGGPSNLLSHHGQRNMCRFWAEACTTCKKFTPILSLCHGNWRSSRQRFLHQPRVLK